MRALHPSRNQPFARAKENSGTVCVTMFNALVTALAMAGPRAARGYELARTSEMAAVDAAQWFGTEGGMPALEEITAGSRASRFSTFLQDMRSTASDALYRERYQRVNTVEDFTNAMEWQSVEVVEGEGGHAGPLSFTALELRPTRHCAMVEL